MKTLILIFSISFLSQSKSFAQMVFDSLGNISMTHGQIISNNFPGLAGIYPHQYYIPTPPIGVNNTIENAIVNGGSFSVAITTNSPYTDTACTVANVHIDNLAQAVVQSKGTYINSAYARNLSAIDAVGYTDSIEGCSATNGSALLVQDSLCNAIYCSVSNDLNAIGFSYRDYACNFLNCSANNESYFSQNNRKSIFEGCTAETNGIIAQGDSGITINFSNALAAGILSKNSKKGFLLNCVSMLSDIGDPIQFQSQDVSTNIRGSAALGGGISNQDTGCVITRAISLLGTAVSRQKNNSFDNLIVAGAFTEGNCNNCFIWGNGNNDRAGSDNTFTIDGPLLLFDQTQGAGKVLTSDANGLSSWQAPKGLPAKADTIINLHTGTVYLSNDTVNIITASGSITSTTLNFPTGVQNDEIQVKFTQPVSTIIATGKGSATVTFPTPILAGATLIFKNLSGRWY